ncbi:MAG: hypothetical protein KAW14_02050 [Candidatus Aegiribacteria sp.]|nr:hypothetical protein [Candidatus Aegiribacteria sp.]
MNTYITVILAYFALIIIISVFTRRYASRSASDFLIAGRNLGVTVCAVVVAAEWLGGMSTIGVSEQAFTTGTLQPGTVQSGNSNRHDHHRVYGSLSLSQEECSYGQ